MKKVGILVGREKTFPEALIKNINERGNGKTTSKESLARACATSSFRSTGKR